MTIFAGMFAILTPVLAIPIILTLGVGMRKHKTDPNAAPVVMAPRAPGKSFGAKCRSVFWQLDLVGLLLLVAGSGMILVTVTIANGKGSKWSDGKLERRDELRAVGSIADRRNFFSALHRSARGWRSLLDRFRPLGAVRSSPSFDSLPSPDQPHRHCVLHHRYPASGRWLLRQWLSLHLPRRGRKPIRPLGDSYRPDLWLQWNTLRCVGWCNRALHSLFEAHYHLRSVNSSGSVPSVSKHIRCRQSSLFMNVGLTSRLVYRLLR